MEPNSQLYSVIRQDTPCILIWTRISVHQLTSWAIRFPHSLLVAVYILQLTFQQNVLVQHATQTCILHLMRSRGTNAVCVVPQLIIPPRPQRRKNLPDPYSQLYCSVWLKKKRSIISSETKEVEGKEKKKLFPFGIVLSLVCSFSHQPQLGRKMSSHIM